MNMNIDIDLQKKYQYLSAKLYDIKNELEELENSYNTLEMKIKKNIEINDDIPMKEELVRHQKNCQNIKKDIISHIIPMINTKI